MVIKAGENYDILFYCTGDDKYIAQSVVATATVGAELTINSMVSDPVGAPGGSPNIYILGDTQPNSVYTIIVNVTVNTETGLLPVTLSVSTDNTELEVGNNTVTKNLMTELAGVFCTEINTCTDSAIDGIVQVILPINSFEDITNPPEQAEQTGRDGNMWISSVTGTAAFGGDLVINNIYIADQTNPNGFSEIVPIDGQYIYNADTKSHMLYDFNNWAVVSSPYDDTTIQSEVDLNTAKTGVTTEEANPDLVSQVDAEAGTSTVEKSWTPERVAQAIAALGGGGPLMAYKTVDETKTSTDTISLDSDLQVELEASSLYTIEVVTMANSSGGLGLNTQLSIPAGATLTLAYDLDSLAAVTYDESRVYLNTGSGSTTCQTLVGTIKTVSAGTFGYNWGPSIVSVNPCTLKEGTNIKLTKLN